MDDDELIAAVARGDDTALRELFTRHAPWLAARLRSALPAADVEDVLQETFLAVWRGARGYRPGGPATADGTVDGTADGAGHGTAGGWLWGIGRRQAALFLRRRGPATLAGPALNGLGPGGIGPDGMGQDAADPADTAQWRVDLARAVAALGPEGSPEREAWRLVHVEDRPVAEAATLMGVPPGTVKSRAHRARQRLREALRSSGTAPRSGGPAQRGGGTAPPSGGTAPRSGGPAPRGSEPAPRSGPPAPRGGPARCSSEPAPRGGAPAREGGTR